MSRKAKPAACFLTNHKRRQLSTMAVPLRGGQTYSSIILY